MTKSWLMFAPLVSSVLGVAVCAGDSARLPDDVRLFVDRAVVVKGRGTAPTGDLSPGQKELLASRAAKVVAFRELAEMLGKVRVSGTTVVKDFSGHDEIRTSVDAVVTGAEVVRESYDERTGVAEVELRVSLDGKYGITATLLPKFGRQSGFPTASHPAPTVRLPPAASTVDGLIVDAAGKNLRPALINRILSAGSIVYEPRMVEPMILARKGSGDYAFDVEGARAILAGQGAKAPMIVSAIGVAGFTDVEISNADADSVMSANQRERFLEAARVVFVF